MTNLIDIEDKKESVDITIGGYCKFDGDCKFRHSELICEEYLRDGLCLKRHCPDRHPRHCRFWTRKPEGCRRGEGCQYLHVPVRRFSGDQRVNRRTLSTIYENDTGEVDDESCDQCDVALHGNRNSTEWLHM